MKFQIIILLALAGCSTARTADIGSAEVTSQQVPAPSGFIAACVAGRITCDGGTDHPSNVELTQARWAQLRDVNEFVNRTVHQISDMDNYGVVEEWTYPNENGGDCEDIALLKRRMLIERGWPADALLLTTAKLWDDNDHEVLTVVTTSGEFILDNLTDTIHTSAGSGYEWVKRQSRMREYVWVNLDRPTAVVRDDKYLPLGSKIPFIKSAEDMRKRK